jgi:peptidoglycan hydrolase-like protein with peptidoglycan-binding domain
MKMHHLVEAESIWALSQRGTVNLPQVKALQDKLRAAGHDPGASDGWYGQKTADAVRSYQQANNLKVDGDAGPQTLASLGMGGANTTPPAETPPAETPPAPAARQAATEPAPTRTEPEATSTRTEPEATSTRTEPEEEPAPDSARSVQYIELSDSPNAREMRDAIRQLELPVRLDNWNNPGPTRQYGGEFMLQLQLTRSVNRSQRNRVMNVIADTIQEQLRASWDYKVTLIVSDESGYPIASPRDLFLDPMPTRNESIQRLSGLAGL